MDELPQTKERKPNEKDLKHQIYIICGIPIDMYIVFFFFIVPEGLKRLRSTER